MIGASSRRSSRSADLRGDFHEALDANSWLDFSWGSCGSAPSRLRQRQRCDRDGSGRRRVDGHLGSCGYGGSGRRPCVRADVHHSVRRLGLPSVAGGLCAGRRPDRVQPAHQYAVRPHLGRGVRPCARRLPLLPRAERPPALRAVQPLGVPLRRGPDVHDGGRLRKVLLQ